MAHPNTLTDRIVTTLRLQAADLVKTGAMPKGWQQTMAKKYHISQTSLSAAITGRSYQHLNATVPGVLTRAGTHGTRSPHTPHAPVPQTMRGDLPNDGISRAKLGKELQHYMQRTNMSQTLFAKLVDDAATQISRLENGHFREFSADRLCKMMLRVGYTLTLTVKRPTGLRLGDGSARVTIQIR